MLAPSLFCFCLVTNESNNHDPLPSSQFTPGVSVWFPTCRNVMVAVKKVCAGFGLVWNTITNVATADLKALVPRAFDIARLQRFQSLAKGSCSSSVWLTNYQSLFALSSARTRVLLAVRANFLPSFVT
jgi:hypothetical protein